MLVTTALLFLGTTITTTNRGRHSFGTGTYAQDQTDTVKWAREENVKSLAFAARYNDTVEVVTARVLRVVNGKPVQQGATTAGDTLTRLTALAQTTTANIALGITTYDAITLAPLADEYWVIVQYDTVCGVAGTTVRYEFIKEYGK